MWEKNVCVQCTKRNNITMFGTSTSISRTITIAEETNEVKEMLKVANTLVKLTTKMNWNVKSESGTLNVVLWPVQAGNVRFSHFALKKHVAINQIQEMRTKRRAADSHESQFGIDRNNNDASSTPKQPNERNKCSRCILSSALAEKSITIDQLASLFAEVWQIGRLWLF